MDPELYQRFKLFNLKAIEDTAKRECKNLCVSSCNNTHDISTESDIQGCCNKATINQVFNFYKQSIAEFIKKSKNGSTASKKEKLVPGSVGSYIASLNKNLEAHWIGTLDINTFMEKYYIEQLKQLMHKQISKPKGTKPSAMNSNCKGALHKFYLYLRDEYYKKKCNIEGCNCDVPQHVKEDITICKNCGCGCCDEFKQHSCHDTEGNCRGKLQCKDCMQYYPYCLFSKFFSISDNVANKKYISYQCDVCASGKTAVRKLKGLNKRHTAPKAGPGLVQTVFEQTKRFDYVTVERTNFERQISKLPDQYNSSAARRIEEEQIEVQVLQKKEIRFFDGFLRFHALVKCKDHRFRYKPGDIVIVHTNEGLRRKGLVKKFFQIIKGTYNATRGTCEYRVNDVTNETDHDNNIENLRCEIILSHEDIKGFYVEEEEIIRITSSHEKTFTINAAHKTEIVTAFNDLSDKSKELDGGNLNYAFDKASISNALISERDKLNNMLDYMKQKMQETLQKEREILNHYPFADNGLQEDVKSYFRKKNKLKCKIIIDNSGFLILLKQQRKRGNKQTKVMHRGNKQTNVETSGSRDKYVSSDEDDELTINPYVEGAQDNRGSELNNEYYIDFNDEEASIEDFENPQDFDGFEESEVDENPDLEVLEENVDDFI